MKNISAWAIKHPVSPVVLFVVLLFMGLVAFVRMPVTLDPDIAFPLVHVLVLQPGAAPQEIETQVLQKVEGSVAGVGNIHNITSLAIEGQSSTWIEFQIGTPIDRAVADVRDAVAKVRSQLPNGIQEPIVQRVDVDGGAIVYYAVSSTSGTESELSWFVDNSVTKRLLAVPGVAQVSRGGGVNREIRVELDPARMQALGITAVDVNQQLRSLNLDSPGGRAQVGGGEQSIRVLGGARTAYELGDTQIALPGAGGRFARLSDIAVVHDGIGEVRSIARLNGRPATTFSVSKAKGFSDVSVMDAVEKELAKVRKENPQVTMSQVFTTVSYTKEQYHSAISAFIEGSILAVIVVWLFLRDGRATTISALAIPLSAIPTFAFMKLMGFSLNSISLLALSLVAGVLVDDAIVEIENIVRHMRMGKSGFQAALDAADQIGLAVVATSCTIMAVFLPVSFMPGISGQYFIQFGLTVAAAVFFSLLVARLITPVIAAYTLKSDRIAEHTDGPVMSAYLRTLAWCVHNRWKTIALGVLFFVVSIVGLALIPKSFVPDADFGTSILQIELPTGVRLEDTAAASAAAARIVARQPEVSNILESIGEDESGEIRNAQLNISLVPRSERHVTQKQWQDRVIQELHRIPDANINFQRLSGNGGRDVNIYITGDDPQLTQATAEKVVEEMRTLSVLRGARINGDLQRPEILIKPRFDLAAQLGVTVANISETIRIATLGDLDQNSAKFSLSDRQVPIRVSLLEATRRDLATLENLPVPTAAGGAVPLKSVADISFGEGPTKVRRYNQSRRISLEADLNHAELGTAMDQIHNLPTLKNLPQGVRLVDVGDAEVMNELFTNFMIAITTGVLMVFAVLVLLFARVLQPITILSSLPLSIGGAVLALMLSRHSLSLGVMIGFLMLMGIVAKNSILLVDFAIEEIRAGKDRFTALIEAGHKRARPIVMTTVAMVAGMMPVAIGLGGDNAFRGPMAIAVIGGLITSTALTLVIVPAAFTIIDDIERWLGPKFGRVLTSQPPASEQRPVERPAEPHPAG
jgi:hydrophobe/amphiphile efflux-1 (HAE1) family protein